MASRVNDVLEIWLNDEAGEDLEGIGRLQQRLMVAYRPISRVEKQTVPVKPGGLGTYPGEGAHEAELIIRPARHEADEVHTPIEIEIDKVAVLGSDPKPRPDEYAFSSVFPRPIDLLIGGEVDPVFTAMLEADPGRIDVCEGKSERVDAQISELTEMGPGARPEVAGQPALERQFVLELRLAYYEGRIAHA